MSEEKGGPSGQTISRPPSSWLAFWVDAVCSACDSLSTLSDVCLQHPDWLIHSQRLSPASMAPSPHATQCPHLFTHTPLHLLPVLQWLSLPWLPAPSVAVPGGTSWVPHAPQPRTSGPGPPEHAAYTAQHHMKGSS